MNRRLPWTELHDPDDVVAAICSWYAERGGERYDEAVTQTVHGVQTALLAESEGAPPPLVAAALLHDLGHLLGREADGHPEHDLRHEQVGARLLGRWFPPTVTEPIRHHVAAKRWLCSADPGYAETLSTASVHSLVLQGGAMPPEEATAFLQLPGASDAIRLRRWDDLAKDPDRPTPGFERYRSLLRAVIVT